MALVGFRGGVTGSRNQACDKGAEQGSPTPARVVHELEAGLFNALSERDVADSAVRDVFSLSEGKPV